MIALRSAVPDHVGKNVIAEPYRQVAAGLCARHGLEADPDEILFLFDEATRSFHPSGSTILKVPSMWREVLYQVTGLELKYVIKFFAANLDLLTPAQAAGGWPRPWKRLWPTGCGR